MYQKYILEISIKSQLVLEQHIFPQASKMKGVNMFLAVYPELNGKILNLFSTI